MIFFKKSIIALLLFLSREEIDVVAVVVDQHTEVDIEENEKLGFQEMKTLMILI